MINTKKRKKFAAVLSVVACMLVIGGGFAISYFINAATPEHAAGLSDDETSLYIVVPICTEEPKYVDVPEYTTEPENLTQIVNATALEPITIYYDGVSIGIEAHPDTQPTVVEVQELTTEVNDSVALLESIYESMGNIMFPTYFPTGFVITRTGINNSAYDAIARGDHANQPGGFAHLDTLTVVFSNGEHEILLWVRPFQPYIWVNREHIRMTADDVPDLLYGQRHVIINGMNAVIGRKNTDITLRDIDSGLAHRFPASVNAPASHSGTIYQFMTCPNSGVSEADLIRMAESLARIIDLMS